MPLIDEEGNRHLPIQEDETALIPYCLWHHWLKYRDIETMGRWFRPLLRNTGNFMVNFREPTTKLPAPSFDLWEEKRAIYSYTTATVWAGLTAIAKMAGMFGETTVAEKARTAAAEIKEACETFLYDLDTGRFVKQIVVKSDGVIEKDFTIDASLYGLWYFGMFETSDPRIERTMKAIEEQLSCQTEVGGIARYKGDEYHWDSALDDRRDKIPGNPWVICTLWLAQYYIAKATTLDELEAALPFLNWVYQRALSSGVLAEQYHPLTGEPLGVSPLTWSHSMVVATVREYIEQYEKLK
jgi:GH15 family glucan-1,4-alpha-glucosidase